MSRSLSSWLLAAVAIASLVVFSTPLAMADLIGSTPVSAPGQTTVHTPSADGVAATLRAQGLSEPEIAARLAEMQPSDLAQLSGSPQQLQVAGLGGAGVAAVIVAGILAVVLIIYVFG